MKRYIKKYSRGLGIVVGDAVRFRGGEYKHVVLLVTGLHVAANHEWLTVVGDWPGSGQHFAAHRFEVVNESR